MYASRHLFKEGFNSSTNSPWLLVDKSFICCCHTTIFVSLWNFEKCMKLRVVYPLGEISWTKTVQIRLPWDNFVEWLMMPMFYQHAYLLSGMTLYMSPIEKTNKWTYQKKWENVMTCWLSLWCMSSWNLDLWRKVTRVAVLVHIHVIFA